MRELRSDPSVGSGNIKCQWFIVTTSMLTTGLLLSPRDETPADRNLGCGIPLRGNLDESKVPFLSTLLLPHGVFTPLLPVCALIINSSTMAVEVPLQIRHIFTHFVRVLMLDMH